MKIICKDCLGEVEYMFDAKRKRFVYICSRCGKWFDPFVSVPYEPVVMDLDTGEIQTLAEAGLDREDLEARSKI
jgi:hypothetical protein